MAWNGNKWIVNITGVDSGRTVCNVYFDNPPAPKGWYRSTPGTLLYAIKQNSQLNPSPPTIPGRAVATTNEGLLAAPDDYGISYYFRDSENNCKFANKCWRIVRVTGDGSIKLVYIMIIPTTPQKHRVGRNINCDRHTESTYTTKFNTSYN